jgi:hypothetical protein
MRLFRSSGCFGARALIAGSMAMGLAGVARPVAGQTKPERPSGVGSGFAELASANQECCRTMLLPIGARQASMAMAVAPTSSPDAVFYNPAGLAQLDGNHFVVHHLESDIQPFDAFTLLVSPGNLAVFGISYALVDHGDQELTGENEQVVGRISSADHLLIASFATNLLANFTAGLSYKFFNWRIDCSGVCSDFDRSAKTHAIDVGVQYQPSWFSSVRIGAALLNAGLPLQVQNAEQSDPLPTRLRLGVSYDVMQHFDSIGPYNLLLLVEAQEDDWKRPTSPRGAVGMEASVGDIVFLRAGYGAGEGLEAGPAVGVGVVYSSFNVAVAKRVNGGLLGDEPFQLTVDVGF